MFSAVNRIASDPEVRKLLIESLVLEKANSECNEVIRQLKARSTAIDDWIRNTVDLLSFDTTQKYTRFPEKIRSMRVVGEGTEEGEEEGNRGRARRTCVNCIIQMGGDQKRRARKEISLLREQLWG